MNTVGGPGRVVQVVQAIDRGGLEMMVVDLAISLQRRGVAQAVIGLDGGGRLEAHLARAGVPFINLGGARFKSPRSHGRIARLLRRLRPDAVHTHHFPSLLNAGPVARALGIRRIVHTEHSFIHLEEHPRTRPLFRWASALSHDVVLVGEALRSYYADTVGVPDRKLRVVPNGVDTTRFAPLPANVRDARRDDMLPETVTRGRVVVGAVGRLAWEKNFGLLLRAAARVPNLAVVLVGDGEEREPLQRLATELGIANRVAFLGWRMDVEHVVPLFDVFAVSSATEGLPLVLLEAMSAAVPVVSTTVGEIPRVLERGRFGLLVPPNNVDAYAAALAQFANDPVGREEAGARARTRVLGAYSQRAMVDAYCALYGVKTEGVEAECVGREDS